MISKGCDQAKIHHQNKELDEIINRKLACVNGAERD